MSEVWLHSGGWIQTVLFDLHFECCVFEWGANSTEEFLCSAWRRHWLDWQFQEQCHMANYWGIWYLRTNRLASSLSALTRDTNAFSARPFERGTQRGERTWVMFKEEQGFENSSGVHWLPVSKTNAEGGPYSLKISASLFMIPTEVIDSVFHAQTWLVCM